MGKISEIFNFDNIGGKIKNLAKWSCWITILLIWIAAPIAFFVLLADDRTAYLCWIPLVDAIVGPVLVWVESWVLYAFGEFVEDIHAIRDKEGTTKEVNAKRESEMTAKYEAEKKAKREADERAKHEAKEQAGREGAKKVISPRTPEISSNNTNDSTKKEHKEKEEPQNILPCPECGEDLSFMGWDENELKEKQSCPLCGKEILFKQ